MSPLLTRVRRRDRSPTTGRSDLQDPAADVTDLMGRVSTVLDLGGERLDPFDVAAAREVLDRVQERAAHGLEQTVVAVAGATGSGKSSLFNAIAGFDISTVGVRRPTTANAVACAWSPGADPLLDWLEVPTRHRTVRDQGLVSDVEHLLDGLVMLDLPDHDSRVEEHRRLVDRLVRRMDLLVWVVDPQKYADRTLHDDYLVPLQGHDDVLVVVLNQVDLLSAEDTAAVTEDLRRLLVRDGLPHATVLTTSATTGEGVDELRRVLADAVASRAMGTIKARADLLDAAGSLRWSMAEDEPAVGDVDGDPELTAALAGAASVPAVLSAIEADYQRQADRYVGWPLVRWASRLRTDPLKRLRLSDPGLPADLTSLARSSVPEPTRAQLARVDLAERQLIDRAALGLPTRWAAAVRAAPQRTDDLRDSLDQAVLSTDLTFRRPSWWSLVGAGHVLLLVAALLGLVGLLGMAAFDFLRIPYPDPPSLGALPLPTVLAVAGLLGGAILAALVRLAVPRLARRRRREAETRLQVAVSRVARERVLSPVADVLADHRRCRELLAR